MSISVGSMSMLQNLVAKGYSETVIRDIMGRAVPAGAIQSLVAATRCAVDLEQQVRLAEFRKAAKLARREAMAAAAREKQRARAAEMFRVIPVRVGSRSISEIIVEVARSHGVSLNDILCAGRSRDIVRIRHEAMYLCARDTPHSLPAMGRRFCRDHTTIIHGIRQHAKRNGLPLPRGMTPEGATA